MSLDFLRRNLGLKIFSVVLAFFLWTYVKYTRMPNTALAGKSKVTVPLSFENKDKKLFALQAPDTVEITVKGPAETLRNINPHHFKAYLDLKDKKAGQYSMKIKVTTPPGVEIVRISPEKVLLQLDPEEERLLSVKVKPSGTIATGFILGPMSSKPESITAKGAQSVLSKVKEIQAVCDVEGADIDRIQQVAVEPVDENGKIVESVSAEPRFVRVTVSVKSVVKNANVPIYPAIEGTPFKGFKIKSIIVKPPIALIRYRFDMESPPGIIKTRPISIKGAKRSVEKEVSPVTPKDVVLASEAKVRVIVNIEAVKKEADKPQGELKSPDS